MAAVLACSILAGSAPASAGPPDGFAEATAFSGLTKPTAVRFSPDGRVFVAQKNGAVKVFDGLGDATATTVIDLSPVVHDYWDRGLLGLALHPDFPAQPFLFLLYTYDFDPVSGLPAPRWGDNCPANPGATTDGCVVNGRLSKIEVTPANTVVGGEQVLIENQWCQQFPSHSIGALTFGAEGALYASAGDGASFNRTDWGQLGGTLAGPITPANPCGDPNRPRGTATVKPGAEGGALRSQDLRAFSASDPTTYDGAILRLDPATGAPWPTNPLIGGTDPGDDAIVAYGLRNPFRMTRRPGTPEIWIGDVGWSSWEEINRIVDPADATVDNFGWPCYEGVARQSGYDGENLDLCETLYNPSNSNVVAPYFTYAHRTAMFSGDTCANGSSSTSGLAFYEGASFPAAYDGALFFADYSRDCIFVMFEGAGGDPDSTTRTSFVTAAANPVDLQVGPGGDLYYADLDGGTIRRVFHVVGNQPPTATIQASPTEGPVPLVVQYDGTGSTDPNPGTTLFYDWDLDGDGQYDDSSIATPTFSYVAPGTIQVGLLVTDDDGATDTETITITAGNTAPTATILAPAAVLTWRVGDPIDFSGEGTDSTDGDLPASAMHWEIVLHHCPGGTAECHPHSVQTVDGVSGGQFTAPDHEYYSYLEFKLRVTDSGGLTDDESVRIEPVTVLLGYETDPAGLSVSVAGTDHVAPYSEPAIVGSSVPLGAPSPQSLLGQSYYWVSWDDGGGQSHTISAGELPQTFLAAFALCVAVETACDGVDEDCDGTTDDVPAPAGPTDLLVDADQLNWGALAGATGYDVVRGSLDTLLATGDFALATDSCAGSVSGTSLALPDDPDPDQGFWFLVRSRSCGGVGSYDGGGAGQIAPRDPAIAASGLACP